MLLEFKCANHRSIKDEIVLSMVATADSTHEEQLIHFENGTRFSRCVSLYGANGSGKTSVLDALALMKRLVEKSYTYPLDKQLPRKPHKLALQEPTTLSIHFERNGIVYLYSFSYTDTAIESETLSYWPNGKIAQIFTRGKNAEFTFAPSFRKQGENCRGRLKDNKLLLSCAVSETNIACISEAFRFFTKDLVFLFTNYSDNWFEYSFNRLSENDSLRATFLAFMHSIGSDVLDIRANTEKRFLSKNELEQLPEALRTKIATQEVETSKITFVYKDFELDSNEESDGVKKLFAFICPLIDIIQSNKVLIYDEIETHLHFQIIQEIIRRFFNNTKSTAQILFSTHDTELLDLDIMRRDQIWFTELKNDCRCTDLYALDEIANVRKNENIRRGYISGKYGAIPMVNTAIQTLFAED